ncbi:MAG: DUF4333 domain-containing protein [Acidimicrobiia bacterium]|nr:DUF4333 domain-containing protein [Acidimicrobiia bacterium]
MRSFRLVVTLLGLLVVASCAESSRLDTEEAEDALALEYVRDTDATVEAVECPEEVDLDEGATFTCTLTLDGQDLDVVATQVDEDGTVEFEARQQVLDRAEVRARVAEQVGLELGQLVEARCGEAPVLVVPDDGTFTCTIVDENGSELPVEARLDEGGDVVVSPAP